jgi:hypothetical protein
VTLLTALATAYSFTVQKNSRQGVFFSDLDDLRRYADTGVHLALHQLSHDLGDGMIGTEAWTAAGDSGLDGKPGTSDDGEGDGIPTPGEPGLAPAPIGPAARGDGLLVWSADTAWPGVKRIVSTAFHQDLRATVEAYARLTTPAAPDIGPVYIGRGGILDLNGNAFVIDGQDRNPDRTLGPSYPMPGITTLVGTPPGSGKSSLIDQVPLKLIDQVRGAGTSPSIAEKLGVDADALFAQFKGSKKTVIASGTYSNVTWGDFSANRFQVTYAKGDVHLSGSGKGAGVLLVDGALSISGRFDFVGVIIARGDVKVTGEGKGVHLYGTVMTGQSLTISGTTHLLYSSMAVSRAFGLLGPSYLVLYWKDLR